MMYLLTAIGLTPCGSSTVHIYTQTMHRTTQSTKTIHRPRTTQFTNYEDCGPCPVFARYTLAFALQLRKKHYKTSQGCRRVPVGTMKTEYTDTVQNRMYRTKQNVQNKTKCTEQSRIYRAKQNIQNKTECTVFIFLVLDIQHALRLRHVVIFGLPGCTVYFHIIS